MEQSELFKVLDFWNYWNNEVRDSFRRDKYLDKINLFKKADENIVLKGIRRSGKSTLMALEIKKLLEFGVKKENILFVNFEEPKFFGNLNLDLLDRIWETYIYYIEPDLSKKIYVFLDEIQNVEAWEKWVLRFYEKKDIQFFITGSSSKLLSKEFSTALAGRHLSVDVFPLGFDEYLVFNNLKLEKKLDYVREENKIRKYFEKYINFGGFPKITLLSDEKLIKEELNSYLETIIIKDISKRYNIGNTEDIKKLAYYFLSNDTKLFSVNKLANLNLGSYDTIKKYISYFKETFLFFELKKFDYSLKAQLINPRKIYSIDLGFVNLLGFNFSKNIGRNLENLVFIELKRRGCDVFYHREKKECDFIVYEKGKITKAIQVSYSLENAETKKREIDGLIDAMAAYNLEEGIILTYEEEYQVPDYEFKINVIPIWKWLLKNTQEL